MNMCSSFTSATVVDSSIWRFPFIVVVEVPVEVPRLAVTVDLTGLLVDILVVDHVQGLNVMLVVTLEVVVVVGVVGDLSIGN